MTAPARQSAYQTLLRIDSGRVDLPSALASGRRLLDDERDRSLAMQIVTGAVRWQRALDHLVAHFGLTPRRQLDREVRIILRLSIFQLLHLDRVPPSAVVDDAVDLTREAGKPRAAPFVNGVLRTLLRQRHRLPLPGRPADPQDRAAALAYLGITQSHPEWLVSRWLDRVGYRDTEAWVHFNNAVPALVLRVNRLRHTRADVAAALAAEGVQTEPSRYASEGLTVVSGHPRPGEADGRYVFQDEASQLVPLVVGAKPGETLLDLCAAPGGKTGQLAVEIGESGLLVASDVRSRRIRLLTEAVRASGATRVRIVQVAPGASLPFRQAFDRVLVDAPCSGLGTIRRDPDIRWRRQPGDLATLARAQRELLARAAAVLKPGGWLIYATCSSEPEENDMVVDAFLAERDDFTLVDLRTVSLPAAVSALVDSRGMFRTSPFAHRLDGFFAAALRRE